MPKMKTKKSLRLRFRATASGELKRGQRNRRHILTKKTTKRKRQLRRPELVAGTHLRVYKQVMGL